ncbi:MAG TPA: DUF4157 domain-containing protein [Pyrinomonadaceae bacterium]|nr:DUF4157 domain-containing protein [Pyrinomonadaceae bacterium]
MRSFGPKQVQQNDRTTALSDPSKALVARRLTPHQLGNRGLARLLGNPLLPIQPKLRVDDAGSPAEHEADRIADQIMQPPAESAEENAEIEPTATAVTEEQVQRKRVAGSNVGSVAAPQIVHDALRSSGHPLDTGTRGFMESRFGHNFSDVRIHTNALAVEAARTLQAEAFTVGNRVFFDQGSYVPSTYSGRHLLAHELAHVVQQCSAGPVSEGLVNRQPKKKKTTTKKPPPKPKPQKFSILGTNFQAVTDPTTKDVKISATGKANDWVFVKAGPDLFTASRSPKNFQYVHAGGTTEPIKQKAMVHAAPDTPVTVDPLQAVLGDPPTLTFELTASGNRAARKKSETVFSASVERIDVTPGFTPADGDLIELGLKGGAYVFSTLKPDPPPAPATSGSTPATPTTPATPPAAPKVQGFFDIGTFTIFKKKTTGFTSHSASDAERAKIFDDLAKSTDPKRKITAAEATVFKTVSIIEHDPAGVQNYDAGILSFGFAQWTVHSDLPRLLLKVDKTVFDRYLGRYGLAVNKPNRSLDSSVAKYIPTASSRVKLGVRNNSEGALFLNGKDLVTEALLKAAKKQLTIFDAPIAKLQTAKTNLTSTNKKDVAAAKKAINSAFDTLKSFPGAKRNKDLALMADGLIKAAQDAKAAAQDLVDNSVSEEVMRGAEWVLRFEMLGQDPDARVAQVAQARETLNRILAFDVGNANYSQLLRSNRARAALLSSYFNNPSGTRKGMSRAVDAYRAEKVAAAKKGDKTDWSKFPWKSSDASWSSFTGAEVTAFEKIAIEKMTAGTHDPDRRRKILAKIPD